MLDNELEVKKITKTIRFASSDNLVKDLYIGTAEKTVRDSPQDFDSQRKPWNPDDIYQKTNDYRIYEEMEVDDQVSVCLDLKRDLILGAGYEFYGDDNDQGKIKDDLYRAFEEDASRSFDDIISEIISAYSFGFSVSEKIFKVRPDGSLTIRDIKTRHPNTWIFHTDKHGNVGKYVQTTDNGEIEVNPGSIIHFIHNSRFGNPYGKSDLRNSYNAWFVKRHVLRMYSIFLEKAASNTPVGKYDQDKTEPADVAAVFTALKQLQAKSAIVIPDVIDIQFLEAGNNGDAYVKGLNLFNMYIGRSLLVPDLMGFQGGTTEGGSYTLGKEQMNIFINHINRRRKAIEKTINEHIVKPLIMYNWGDIPFYPKFRFKPVSEDDSIELAKTFISAMQGKFYKPTEDEINHFRNLIKFPESEDVELIEAPAIVQDNNPKSDEDDIESTGIEPDDQIDLDKENEIVETEVKEFKSAYKTTYGDFHKKVDFKIIGNQLEARKEKILAELLPIYREAFIDLKSQIENKKVIERKKIESISDLRIKGTGKAIKILNSQLSDHYNDSKTTAANELYKINFTLPLKSDEFERLLDEENFGAIRDWDYSLFRLIEQELRAALKDGRPLSSVFDNLDSTVEDKTRQSIERYARTKTTEVMNRARVDFFESTGSVQGYQYSAILDGRTSPICEGLHGAIFEKGKQPVPPLHFNCRSVLIPITIFEELKPTTSIKGKSPSDFIDKNIGSGFSIK